MQTYTALTTLPGKPAAQALGAAMEAMTPEPTGVGVFELEDASGLWEVGAYFVEPPDAVALALLAAAFGARPFTVSQLPQTDWVAHVRRELAPVEAGRFYLYGSHDLATIPEGRIALLIEASMAFGTGHHGTTLGCLLALDALVDAGLKPGRVLDLGCGTAVLAMAAARVWPVPVYASDIDPVAIEVAQANLEANQMGHRVTCIETAGLDDSQIRDAAPFDLVFANILKGPLVALAPEIFAVCANHGYVILSGILREQEGDVREAYEGCGFAYRVSYPKGDWVTLLMQK